MKRNRRCGFLSWKKKNRIMRSVTIRYSMEQTTGIGPAYSAWEADILPLNYVCVYIDYNEKHRTWKHEVF